MSRHIRYYERGDAPAPRQVIRDGDRIQLHGMESEKWAPMNGTLGTVRLVEDLGVTWINIVFDDQLENGEHEFVHISPYKIRYVGSSDDDNVAVA